MFVCVGGGGVKLWGVKRCGGGGRVGFEKAEREGGLNCKVGGRWTGVTGWGCGVTEGPNF